MGVVYRATDTRLDRTVAIKALPAEFAADPARLERFEREARTLAQLNHPNLAGIHGVEEQDGGRHLVLEHVEGQSLAERLDRGPLPVDEAVELAAQIAAGVEAAHDAGVIHRDLKPANVMITPEGQAKVLDFGLARADDGTLSSTGMLGAPTLTDAEPVNSPTIPGAILGTAPYMSPEQARGRRVDRRTDIWSFGVVLYEMLAGASPFVGETASDSLGAVLHKSFGFEQLPDATPAHIRRVLERCLERDKTQRYRDIGDVRLDLLASTPEDIAPAGPVRSVLPLVAVFTAVVLGLVAGLTFVLLDRPTPTVARVPAVAASVLMPDGVRVNNVALAPDGQTLVMIGQVFDEERPDASFRGTAYVRDLGDGTVRVVESINDPYCAAFSPDGRWVVFACNSIGGTETDLYRMPADLSAPPALIGSMPPTARVAGWQWFTFTPDSDIAFLDRAEIALVVMDVGTGEEVRRVPIQGDGIDNNFGSFVGPFGDRWISIGAPMYTDEGYREDVLLIDVTTGESTRPLTDAGNAVLAGGDRLFFARGAQMFESGFDRQTLRPTGEIRPVHEDLAARISWTNGEFQLSQNGVLAYLPGGVRGTQRSIVTMDFDFVVTPWSDERQAFQDGIAFSRDGDRIAVVVASANGLFQIWVADTERRRFRRLLAQSGFDLGSPRFTADGESVIASRYNPEGGRGGEIIVMPFDGDGVPRVIFKADDDEGTILAEVSDDGSWLLATVRSTRGERRFVEIPISGEGEPREIEGLHQTSSNLRYAPGGFPMIAYTSAETGAPRLYLRRYQDGVLGAEIPISDEDVLAVGWSRFDETSATLSYLRADRSAHLRTITYDGRIRIGPSESVGELASRFVDVAFTPNKGGVGIRFGEDEDYITRVDIVTDFTGSPPKP